jgi:hypothetical protein
LIAITISVAPAGSDRYTARLAETGRILTTAREPLFVAARVLLAEGANPATKLLMRWEGSAVEALRSTIGTAAALSVHEGECTELRFAKFRPFDVKRVEPLARAKPSRRAA